MASERVDADDVFASMIDDVLDEIETKEEKLAENETGKATCAPKLTVMCT